MYFECFQYLNISNTILNISNTFKNCLLLISCARQCCLVRTYFQWALFNYNVALWWVCAFQETTAREQFRHNSAGTVLWSSASLHKCNLYRVERMIYFILMTCV